MTRARAQRPPRERRRIARGYRPPSERRPTHRSWLRLPRSTDRFLRSAGRTSDRVREGDDRTVEQQTQAIAHSGERGDRMLSATNTTSRTRKMPVSSGIRNFLTGYSVGLGSLVPCRPHIAPVVRTYVKQAAHMSDVGGRPRGRGRPPGSGQCAAEELGERLLRRGTRAAGRRRKRFIDDRVLLRRSGCSCTPTCQRPPSASGSVPRRRSLHQVLPAAH